MFLLFGYDLWVFLLFCALYITLTFLFKAQAAIIATLVAISQMQGNQDIYFAANSLVLIIIGIGVALLLSLYMPKDKKIIKKFLNLKLVYHQTVGFLKAVKNIKAVQLDGLFLFFTSCFFNIAFLKSHDLITYIIT
jgi:hypothetical protein